MRITPLRLASLASLTLLAACGPGRLSDRDLTRLCELQVRCGGGVVSQASCEAIVGGQRDAFNMQGCGGQFGALSRCAIRGDECTLPADCADEQMRLDQCVARHDTSGTDAGRPDANGGGCTAASETDFTHCSDGCDNDGDGTYDCNDEGCCGAVECGTGTLCGGGSCTPADESSFTYCSDGCDNDGDGAYDCNDTGCCETLAGSCGSSTVCGASSCTPASFEEGSLYCTDGCDNDGNGVFDCNESACCATLEGSCAAGTVCGGGVPDVSARNELGWVEVYYMGEWRPICDDGFTMADADVTCRMLGYTGADSYDTSVSGTNDSFWLDDISCTGSESSLAACTHSGWGVENCSSSECVQVHCY